MSTNSVQTEVAQLSPNKQVQPIHIHKYYLTFRRKYLSEAPCLDNEELMEYLDVAKDTLNQWCSRGKIGYSMPTNRRFFLREDIERFLNQNRKEAYNGDY